VAYALPATEVVASEHLPVDDRIRVIGSEVERVQIELNAPERVRVLSSATVPAN
jgi:hypothetical protein